MQNRFDTPGVVFAWVGAFLSNAQSLDLVTPFLNDPMGFIAGFLASVYTVVQLVRMYGNRKSKKAKKVQRGTDDKS